jgi:predicted nucleic acid-binding protein
MARRTECYVDTSAFIAFLDRSDSHHALFRRLFSAPPPLISSALVVAEGHGWFLRRYDRRWASQFLAFLDVLPGFTLRGFDASELAKTRVIVKKFSDQDITLADAHGLAIMRELKIGCCWSTDRRLGLDGVPLVVGGTRDARAESVLHSG